MKKCLSCLLCLLLCGLLLCGCTGMGLVEHLLLGRSDPMSRVSSLDGRTEVEVPHFYEIEYLRPELDGLEESVKAVEAALNEGESLVRVMALLDECYREYYHFYTMYSLADIMVCMDVNDEYYAAEFTWCDNNFPKARQLMEDMYYLCGGSELAEKLERRYFWDGFAAEYAEDSGQPLYSERLIELMERESALIAEYRQLLNAPSVEIDGVETDLYDYLLYADDGEYDRAMELYYTKYNPRLTGIYIELVKLRHELAAEQGYDSYEQMQYEWSFSRDYRPDQANAYIEDIKEYMVPLYAAVAETDPYSRISYDSLSERRLLAAVGSAAGKMGGDVDTAFRFMQTYGYYDCTVSANKANMSFQSYLTEYEAPFLFMDPYGDMEDVLTLSHEFGHYVNAFVNYDASESIDVTEVFSQGLEYLMLGFYGDVLSKGEIENLQRMKMMDTLELYVQQASFADFERRVYEADPEELDAEFLNGLSLELAKEYGYYDGESEICYAMSWTDIVHFYEKPFYIVTYPVSNDAAMQLYSLEREEPGKGVEKYQEMLSVHYAGLVDTLESAGLESPFEDGRIETVAAELREILLG